MNSARVLHPLPELLIVCLVERNPIRRSSIKAARLDNATIDPIVHDMVTDPESLRHLLNSQLRRPYQRGPRNLVAVSDPFDHGTIEGFAQGANMTLFIEPISDLPVSQVLGEIPDVIYDRGGVPYPIGHFGR